MTVEEIIARAVVVHAEAFGAIGFDQKFPPRPSTATWEEYSKVEQATARLAAVAVIGALEAAGYRIMGYKKSVAPPILIEDDRP